MSFPIRRRNPYASFVPTTATTPAMTTANTPGINTLDRIPCHSTPPVPTAATIAPTMPPINAWLDDEGSPKYHVVRLNPIAPSNPAKMIVSVIEP
jgi:hypothetical protein